MKGIFGRAYSIKSTCFIADLTLFRIYEKSLLILCLTILHLGAHSLRGECVAKLAGTALGQFNSHEWGQRIRPRAPPSYVILFLWCG